MKSKAIVILSLSAALAGCTDDASPGEPGNPPANGPGEASCELVSSGTGAEGTSPVGFESVVTGLDVPWGVAIIPGPVGNDWLVTERPGRVRLVRNGALAPDPVVTIEVAESGEGGLLGIAADPRFATNSRFFVYYTTAKNGRNVNRVERFTLSQNHATATSDGVILDDIPAAAFHNGGRIKFGPDGFLYVGTGDAGVPERSRDESSLNGKILRITTDGAAAEDNPVPGNRWFIKGVRNVEGFDWLDGNQLVIADHGPSGELGRTGGDEISIARKGADLGWPTIWHCETQPGLTAPILSWEQAVPPGGLAIDRGSGIPGWNGNVIVGTLGSRHVHRIVLDSSGASRAVSHEAYFPGDPPAGLGRVREVFSGPSGELYVTTSNCDSRGTCPAARDGIYRLKTR